MRCSSNRTWHLREWSAGSIEFVRGGRDVCLPQDRQQGGEDELVEFAESRGRVQVPRLVPILDLVALTPVGRVVHKALRENSRNNGCLHNHYPRGEGLATSPGGRARLRFHSPVMRVTRRRCGLA
jgi:hypothetical protein